MCLTFIKVKIGYKAFEEKLVYPLVSYFLSEMILKGIHP